MSGTRLALLATRLVLAAAAIAAAGCVTPGTHSLDEAYLPARAPNLDGRLVVGVLPFSHETLTSHRSGVDVDVELLDRQDIARLERRYMAARMVEVLGASRWFEGVYVVPEATPGVDVMVGAHVRRSDGEVTSVRLEVTRVDGVPLGSETLGVNLARADWQGPGADPTERYWVTGANRIAKIVSRSKRLGESELVRARVAAYAGPAVSAPRRPAPPRAPSASTLAIVDRATEIERDKYLAPMTAVMLEQSRAIRPAYLEWLRQSTHYREARREATAEAVGLTLISLVSAAAGGYYGVQGEAGPVAGDLSRGSAAAFGQALSLRSESAQMGDALDELRAALGTHAGPLNLKLEDTVHQLEGTTAAQLHEIRAIVRAELASEAGN